MALVLINGVKGILVLRSFRLKNKYQILQKTPPHTKESKPTKIIWIGEKMIPNDVKKYTSPIPKASSFQMK